MEETKILTKIGCLYIQIQKHLEETNVEFVILWLISWPKKNIFLDLYSIIIIIITYTYVFYFIPNLHSIQIHTEESFMICRLAWSGQINNKLMIFARLDINFCLNFFP